ncbi:MAG: M23 family metallopeptidase [Bacteroidales bacterium]|jgi:murein DD-endopeptidase MepM/ murein hydrolase activator NlpD|nr:M23 family metallopeptidase [Bacteroidales bacterium]MDI9575087.1 M23 family metallopeptidase [Bacteroidota bacterium]MDD2592743.1 M23 family metallopeptidase [Bacteroidales bacterium]MDD3755256.1 M23 family metallopeptidase [Bacteroidales bacterium]MDY0400481.1 M23 family metallopeptidase [Bacteroidales bacterium]
MKKNKSYYQSLHWENLYLKPYKTTKRYISIVLGVIATALALGFIFTLIAIYIFPSKEEEKKAYELAQLEKIYEEIQNNQKQIEILLDTLSIKNNIIFKNIFNTDYIDEDKEMNTSKITSAKSLSDMLKIIDENLTKIKQKSNIQYYYYNFLFHYLPENINDLMKLPIRMPLKENYEIASGFGERIHPILKNTFFHTGIDFAAPLRTPVYATASGVVRNPDKSMFGYGETIIIDHGNNISTVYAHLLEKKVATGRKVSAGELIGYVGNTGISFGIHLHYEIRIKNNPVNPIQFFITLDPQIFYHYYLQAKIFNQALS